MSLRTLLAPPVFPGDDTKTHRAKLLNYALLANLALMAFCVVAASIGSHLPALVIGAEIALAAVSLLLRHWVFQGRIRLASGALLIVGFLVITVVIARLGTIRVPATGFYIALVIAAGFLFDLGAMLLLIVFSSVTVGGLIWAENAGLLPPPVYAVTITQWLATTALFACIGGWTYAALSTIRAALRRAEFEVTERQRAEDFLFAKNAELEEALGKVKTLGGMLPICSGCKKIRDDRNYWHQVEHYISEHSDASFTHSLCPACLGKYFPDAGAPSSSGQS
ncbi:MAG: hypothetical protein ACHQ5A_11170 [Opitutales bacterium]